jgi:hypothetical protein
MDTGGGGCLSLGVKRPEREADNSPPSNAEVTECVGLYFHPPNTPSWRGAQLKRSRETQFWTTVSFTRILLHGITDDLTTTATEILLIFNCSLGAGIAQSVYRLGYGLDDRSSIPKEDNYKNLSLRHRIQNGSGAHPASYPVGIGGKMAGAWSYTSSLPTHLHRLVLS